MAKGARFYGESEGSKHVGQSGLLAHRGADYFYPKGAFLTEREDDDSAGKPIVLGENGQLDTTLLPNDIVISGSVSAGADAEVMSVFGRTKIGHLIEASDYALFAHYDHATVTNYALLQSSNGTTYLNAADGMPINLKINNAQVGSINSWGLALVSTKTIGLEVAAQTETSIGPNGVVYKNLITSGGNAKHLAWLTDDDDVSQFALGTRTDAQDFLYGFIGTAYTSTWLRYYPTGQVMVGNAAPLLTSRQFEVRRNGENVGILVHEDAGTHEAALQLRRGDADWEIINRGNLVVEHEDNVIYTVVRPGTNTLSAALTAMSNGDCLLMGAGTYIQSVQLTIPNTVTHFSVVGIGMGCTVIDFTADVHGFRSSTALEAHRIQQCKLEGFKMTMSAVSSAQTAIHLFGDSSNRTVSPSIIIRDVGMARTDTNKYWGIGINLINSYGALIDNCFIRTYHSGAACYGEGVRLQSCVNTQIRGGEYFELNKAFKLVKASDALIYGSNKHGCEGVCFDSSTVVYAETGIELGPKALNIMINNITLDFIMDYGIYEGDYDSSAGYHVIKGGWIAADQTNCTADSHLVYLRCPGTTIEAVSITGSPTVDINGITITGSTAPTGLGVYNNIIRYCETGLYVHKVQNSVFSGNRCSSGQGTYDIVLTADADYNIFNANISPKVLFITAGATGNTVTSNKVPSVDDNGTSTILDNNG